MGKSPRLKPKRLPEKLLQIRQRLGLSAREMALLLGVSQISVYNWEQGKARPRAAQLAAIAAVRKLGKREAAERLGQASG